MPAENVRIPLFPGRSLSGILHDSEKGGKAPAVILAHGAGNDKTTPLLAATAEGLARSGFPSLRFNFPYKDAGRKAPDRPDILEKAWRAAFEWMRAQPAAAARPIVAAGKSMGGRIASQMAASGSLPADALIFLGYPLHPPGNRERLRDAHLPAIRVPMLFLAGTRDRLCDLSVLETVLTRLRAPYRLEIVEGGDHSFTIPKSMGISRDEVYARILARIIAWLNRVRVGASFPLPP